MWVFLTFNINTYDFVDRRRKRKIPPPSVINTTTTLEQKPILASTMGPTSTSELEDSLVPLELLSNSIAYNSQADIVSNKKCNSFSIDRLISK